MHPEADLPGIIAGLRLRTYTGTLHRLVDFATLTGYDPMMPFVHSWTRQERAALHAERRPKRALCCRRYRNSAS